MSYPCLQVVYMSSIVKDLGMPTGPCLAYSGCLYVGFKRPDRGLNRPIAVARSLPLQLGGHKRRTAIPPRRIGDQPGLEPEAHRVDATRQSGFQLCLSRGVSSPSFVWAFGCKASSPPGLTLYRSTLARVPGWAPTVPPYTGF